MSTYSKLVLSGSTDGKGVKVAATSIGSGTTIHTAGGSPDLVTLFAYNDDTATRVLTLGWGGTTGTDNTIDISIPSKTGLVLVTADLPIQNSQVVKAAADVANKVVLYGYVNRIT